MATNYSNLMANEKVHMDGVYRTLDKKVKASNNTVKNAQAYKSSGSYDDTDAFMVHSQLNAALSAFKEEEKLISRLYPKPYFAHVEIEQDDDLDDHQHYYLSDCEALSSYMQIGSNGGIVPFKLDKERPFISELFHCYQSHNGKAFILQNTGEEYRPVLICDDDISNKKLKSVSQLFPTSEGVFPNADELLEERLEQNRNNPELRNIIATLQRKQFEVIETSIEEEFVVQGCAGSGKSQCLLHRLFYLRDYLSDDRWEHVLLITPTQLFRNYSRELVRRYQLSDINNYSIAGLYQQVLEEYDDRFKNRQYVIELTEEYLPDEYLYRIYEEKTLKTIEAEIENAINSHVQECCNLLGIRTPDKITISEINPLVERLDKEIEAFDEREEQLKKSPEYVREKAEYESIQKSLAAARRRLSRMEESASQLLSEKEKLNDLYIKVREAERRKKEWLHQNRDSVEKTQSELLEMAGLEGGNVQIGLPAQYADKLFELNQLLSGEATEEDQEYRKFLDESIELQRTEFAAFTKNKSFEKADKDIQQRIGDAEARLKTIKSDIEDFEKKLAESQHELELIVYGENEKQSTVIERNKLTLSRYYLSRIESAVFESEVWRVLSPIKEKYNIQTLNIEKIDQGHQRESRILYKSDLLFYLMIYQKLYPNAILPDYRLICIDEGQDLHKADYEMLHKLFPQAKLNVFGDTDQVLHESCGVRNWQRDTGIRKIYELNRNYRNEAAIVVFCNYKFGVNMKYFGKADWKRAPKTIHSRKELIEVVQLENMAIIVKDIECFRNLCKLLGSSSEKVEYLDTRADSVPDNIIPCYSIFAAKGLEFSNVTVFSKNMSNKQKVVGCTRATERLFYYE